MWRRVVAWWHRLWRGRRLGRQPRTGDAFVYNGFRYLLGPVTTVDAPGGLFRIRSFRRPLGATPLEESRRKANPAWKLSGSCLDHDLCWMTRSTWGMALAIQADQLAAGNPDAVIWSREAEQALLEAPPFPSAGAWVLPGCHLLPAPQKHPRNLHPDQFLPQEHALARQIARAMLQCDNETVER